MRSWRSSCFHLIQRPWEAPCPPHTWVGTAPLLLCLHLTPPGFVCVLDPGPHRPGWGLGSYMISGPTLTADGSYVPRSWVPLNLCGPWLQMQWLPPVLLIPWDPAQSLGKVGQEGQSSTSLQMCKSRELLWSLVWSSRTKTGFLGRCENGEEPQDQGCQQGPAKVEMLRARQRRRS